MFNETSYLQQPGGCTEGNDQALMLRLTPKQLVPSLPQTISCMLVTIMLLGLRVGRYCQMKRGIDTEHAIFKLRPIPS